MATKRKTAIIGLGYVGLANLAWFLKRTNDELIAFDIDEEKIASLKGNRSIFDENELRFVIEKGNKRIRYTSDPKDLSDADIYLLAVGTPSLEDGSCDMSHVEAAISLIEEYASKENIYLIIRSTVRIGTADEIRERLSKKEGVAFHIISMPEFLAQGTSYKDEMNPYRLVVGAADSESFRFIEKLRKHDTEAGVPIYEMSNASAELSKYASNVFLATKISFVNEMARLAEVVGADIDSVSRAMGADPRIGNSMLRSGIGYGGSCFPKDTIALTHLAKEKGVALSIPEATHKINETQLTWFLEKIEKHLGSLKGKRIALFGLSYKAGTADLRYSRAYALAELLLKEGASLAVYDPSPKAVEKFASSLKVDGYKTMKETIQDADALVLLTDDLAFRTLNEEKMLPLMKGRFLFDGRNIYSLDYFKSFSYISVGRREVLR